MKVILLIFIFLMFIAFGICFYSKYLLRVHFFEDMVLMSKYFKNAVGYSKDDFNILLNNCLSTFHPITRKILTNFDKSKTILNKSDNQLIMKCFNSLGHGDVMYELNNLTYYENLFLERLNYHKDNKKNGSLYLKLIIGLGLLVVIILI